MPKPVLFVQGGGAGAHREDAALAESLRAALGPEFGVSYPQMPMEDDPDQSRWASRIAHEMSQMGDGAILVGHSVGATILLTMLLEGGKHERIAGVMLLAAPFMGQGGWEVPGFALPRDSQDRFPAAVPLYFYHGEDDETVPFTHAELYARVFPRALLRRIQGCNHQFNEDLAIVAEDIVRLEARA